MYYRELTSDLRSTKSLSLKMWKMF